jgi:hypothetical protein
MAYFENGEKYIFSKLQDTENCSFLITLSKILLNLEFYSRVYFLEEVFSETAYKYSKKYIDMVDIQKLNTVQEKSHSKYQFKVHFLDNYFFINKYFSKSYENIFKKYSNEYIKDEITGDIYEKLTNMQYHLDVRIINYSQLSINDVRASLGHGGDIRLYPELFSKDEANWLKKRATSEDKSI